MKKDANSIEEDNLDEIEQDYEMEPDEEALSKQDELENGEPDSDESEEQGLEDYVVGEETVLMDGIELSEELIPHEAQGDVQLPSDDDLEFPDLPEEEEDIPPPPTDLNENEPEEIDELDVNEELTLEDDEEVVMASSSPDDAPEVTATREIDLTQENSSIKDKLDQLKVKVSDKFRKLNNKEMSSKVERSITPKLNLYDIKSSAAKVNWLSLPSQFFSHKTRPKIHRWYQKGFIFLVVFSITKITASLISGSPDYQTLTRKNYISFNADNKLNQNQVKKVQKAKVFDTFQPVQTGPQDKPKANLNKICTEASKKSNSSAQLLSTIVLQDSVKSIASVQVRSGANETMYLRQGDELSGDLKVDKIEGRKIIVRNLKNGDCEYIENSGYEKQLSRIQRPSVLSAKKSAAYKKKVKEIKGIETDGNNFKIDKKFLQSKLKDMNSILSQAKGIPIKNPDGTLSFKIVEVEPGGVFEYLGITDGDFITEINGRPIQNLNEVMNWLGKIQNVSSLNLTLKRNGESVNQSYNIK